MIERFVFPEMNSSMAKHEVGIARGNALDAASDAFHRNPRPEEHVHVIGHHHVSVEFVLFQFFAAKEGAST